MNKTCIVIKNLVSKEICEHISNELRLIELHINSQNPKLGLEDTVPESFNVYCSPATESLMVHIQPEIEKRTGKTLFPTYSYARIYKTGSKLDRHLDRRSSEFTVSCCLSKDPIDWPLVIEDIDTGEQFSENLNQGDILLYQGRKHFHWRDGNFKGAEQIQTFIQYVDVNGNSADLKWDTKPALGLPWSFISPALKQELEGKKNVKTG
jgi:hypothetical protein